MRTKFYFIGSMTRNTIYTGNYKSKSKAICLDTLIISYRNIVIFGKSVFSGFWFVFTYVACSLSYIRQLIAKPAFNSINSLWKSGLSAQMLTSGGWERNIRLNTSPLIIWCFAQINAVAPRQFFEKKAYLFGIACQLAVCILCDISTKVSVFSNALGYRRGSSFWRR